ncbi:MAG: peptidoglycan editing factor PgeF [Erythrobacter sp.]
MSAAQTPFVIERAPNLAGVPHGFFGSAGGAHQFGYGGPGGADAIRALRAAAAEAVLPGAALAAPHQVHSPDVITVTAPWDDAPEGRPVADSVVTACPRIVLGIVTADCAPVLFADPQAGVVGAAHAGWRGAHGGVLEATIAAMEGLGAQASRIKAAIGPTIAQASYEVDASFRENFTPEDEGHFAPAEFREGRARWHFDLPGYIIKKLEKSGLVEIHDLGRDTFAEDVRYHSYRRAQVRCEPDYGRQISLIAAA